MSIFTIFLYEKDTHCVGEGSLSTYYHYEVIKYVPSPIKYQKLSIISSNVKRYIFTGYRNILNWLTFVDWKGTGDIIKWKIKRSCLSDIFNLYLYPSIYYLQLERHVHQIVETNNKLVSISKYGFYIYMFALKKIVLERQDSKEPVILNIFNGSGFLSNRK